jgi:hypothetical protein
LSTTTHGTARLQAELAANSFMQLRDVKIHGSLGNLLANLAEKIVGVTNAVIAQVGFQTPLAKVSRLDDFSQYEFQ